MGTAAREENIILSTTQYLFVQMHHQCNTIKYILDVATSQPSGVHMRLWHKTAVLEFPILVDINQNIKFWKTFVTYTGWDPTNQCPGSFLGHNHNVPSPTSYMLTSFSFPLLNCGMCYIYIYIPLKWLIIFLKFWTLTCYFLNSTSWSVTSNRVPVQCHQFQHWRNVLVWKWWTR